jgi:hypothetical protein
MIIDAYGELEVGDNWSDEVSIKVGYRSRKFILTPD